jgi:glucose/arabinose dehydrogenase
MPGLYANRIPWHSHSCLWPLTSMLRLSNRPYGGELSHKSLTLSFISSLLLTFLVCSGCGNSISIVSLPPTPPTPATFDLLTVATGFTNPLDIKQPNDNSGRLFVVEQPGHIQIIENNGARAASPFLDVTGLSNFISGGELGLLGLAFHPQYSTNHRFFVNYTRQVTGQIQTVIAEFATSATNPEFADPASQKILLIVNQPTNIHKGGGLNFGPDTFLYIALGDGGPEDDPSCNGQNINTFLGKILRIDVNSTPAAGKAYAIPPTNPFVGQASGLPEIYLYGLRNPFRFSFDTTTNLLWIGDVGQDLWEEIDRLTANQSGANLGWNLREGLHPYAPSTCTQTPGSTFTDPIFNYDHTQGDDAITGGYVYHGIKAPALAGAYIFGDFISGRVWELTSDNLGNLTRTQLTTTAANDLPAFGQDQSGELYLARYSSGTVVRLHQVGQP